MEIVKEIGMEAALGQLAEEAAELGHAALKLQRIINGTYPTPVTESQAKKNLQEEATDVLICLEEIGKAGIATFNPDVYLDKTGRWPDRIAEARK